MFTYHLVFLQTICVVVSEASCSKRPHIILIVGDDLGWNDVSFHGSPQIPTPNIDALAASGIVLVKHYAAPQCSPSRAALLSGRYTIHTGLQHRVIVSGQPLALPLDIQIMPQYFKQLGYDTHLVGKWHLGYYKKEFTPIFRGFDSAFGYWNGQLDHYDYTNYEGDENHWGVDLHDGLKHIKHLRGLYAAGVFTDKAVEKIRRHDSSKPMFLYVSQIVPHIGNSYQPLQAPPQHVAKFKYITDMNRRVTAGAISTLDESVGKIFAALDAKSMLNNSIIVFISDNGAAVAGERGAYGSNWPLRGGKFQLFEGGVRVPALIWSPMLQLQQPRISKQMMHISDWVPTLYVAAGGNPKDFSSIDGIDMWKHLMENLPSPRNEILLNVDPHYGMASLIQNDYKLVNGTYLTDDTVLWYGPSGRDLNVSSMDEWVWKNGSVVKDILHKIGRWLIREPDKWRQNVTVDCGSPSPPSGNGGCDSSKLPCLFNITKDPCEYHNLASLKPQVVKDMMNRIKVLNATSLPSLNPDLDPKADPRCHGFSFVPWRDPEYASQPCDIAT